MWKDIVSQQAPVTIGRATAVYNTSSTHVNEDHYICGNAIYRVLSAIGSDEVLEVSQYQTQSSDKHGVTRVNVSEPLSLFWHGELSNWHMCQFTAPFPWYLLAGTNTSVFPQESTMVFNCTEQYMMFAKAVCFGDWYLACKIMEATSPKVQKELGRKVADYDEERWKSVRKAVVFEANYHKFSQHEYLRDVLMSTNGTACVEASPYDRVWGIGLAATDPRAYYRSLWNGENLLGEVLDDVRKTLMEKPIIVSTCPPWIVSNRPKRVALLVGRFQPLHRAHCMVIERMIQDNDVVIVGIGSIQEHGTMRNPYPAEVRERMLRNVFGNRISIVFVPDLGTGLHTQEWVNHVLKICTDAGLPLPNRYYCGCHDNSLWYQGYFSGSQYQTITHGDTITYQSTQHSDRELIILERSQNHYIPATRVREYINLRMDDWKWYIPEINHVLVEANYPQQFRVPITGKDDSFPIGTYAVVGGSPPTKYQRTANGWDVVE